MVHRGRGQTDGQDGRRQKRRLLLLLLSITESGRDWRVESEEHARYFSDFDSLMAVPCGDWWPVRHDYVFSPSEAVDG